VGRVVKRWTKKSCQTLPESTEGVTEGGRMTTRLTKVDRCDRCGSEAYLMAIKDDLHPLMFCAHHGRKHEASLTDSGWEILDESHRLISREKQTAGVS